MEIDLRQWVCLAFFLYYAIRTAFYFLFYQDIIACTEWNVLNFPDSFSAWIFKGGIEQNLQLMNRAYDSFLMAYMIRPYDFRINRNLFFISLALGKIPDARAYLEGARKSKVYEYQEAKKAETLKFMEGEMEKLVGLSDKLKLVAGKPAYGAAVGRNEPCPCGSGLKFKRCCGR